MPFTITVKGMLFRGHTSFLPFPLLIPVRRVLGFYHKHKWDLATDDDDKDFHYSSSGDSYIQAAKCYPEDDENHICMD